MVYGSNELIIAEFCHTMNDIKQLVQTNQSNLEKHGVLAFEAEEALVDGWKKRRRDGNNYEILGISLDGRFLQLVVEITPQVIRIFHGRDMSATERRRYKRK